MKPKRYIIDIDGVISRKKNWSKKDIRQRPPETFLNIKPDNRVIKKINSLFYDGHIIVLHTSRIWHDYNATVKWLEKVGCLYDTLIMAKPLGDHYVDDKNMSIKEFLNEG